MRQQEINLGWNEYECFVQSLVQHPHRSRNKLFPLSFSFSLSLFLPLSLSLSVPHKFSYSVHETPMVQHLQIVLWEYILLQLETILETRKMWYKGRHCTKIELFTTHVNSNLRRSDSGAKNERFTSQSKWENLGFCFFYSLLLLFVRTNVHTNYTLKPSFAPQMWEGKTTEEERTTMEGMKNFTFFTIFHSSSSSSSWSSSSSPSSPSSSSSSSSWSSLHYLTWFVAM